MSKSAKYSAETRERAVRADGDPRQGREDDGLRQGGVLSAEPAVPSRSSECAMGGRLHVRVDLAGTPVCGLRDRRVRPPHHRLEVSSNTMRADFVPYALEQALYARKPFDRGRLIHPQRPGITMPVHIIGGGGVAPRDYWWRGRVDW